MIRVWSVTIAAALVLVLGAIELISSGRLSAFARRGRGPGDLSGIVMELERAIDGELVKLGVSGATSEREDREDGRYTWTHIEKKGSIPHDVGIYECNLAITRAVRRVGGRIIRGADQGPDYQGLRTLDLRIGHGDIETHRLVLKQSAGTDAREDLAAAGSPPRIAIVIDDFGYNGSETTRGIIDLDFPITISIIPNCPHTTDVAHAAHSAGKEVLVHIPMEPRGYPEVDPGEGALMSDHTREQLVRRIDDALDDVPHAVGANNHMGSAFTSQHIPMRVLMHKLRDKGFFFLDSMTTPESVGITEARRAGVPTTRNRMFIDSPVDESGRIDVESQFTELVAVARKLGVAVGIGHPHPETLRVLRKALPELESEGIELVFVSELVK
ncbi:MAG: divergent polysaccharide deacetylase family protein [Candidatus Eisenbacteria bacterium]